MLFASLTWAQDGNARAALLAKDNAQAQKSLKLIREKVATIKAPALKSTVLAMLETKTKGNLDEAEHKLLASLVYDLRVAYVDAQNAAKK